MDLFSWWLQTTLGFWGSATKTNQQNNSYLNHGLLLWGDALERMASYQKMLVPTPTQRP